MSGARGYMPSWDASQPTWAVHERTSGPLTEITYGGPWIELHSLAEFDAWIRVLVSAKAEHGAALARHQAAENVPRPGEGASPAGPMLSGEAATVPGPGDLHDADNWDCIYLSGCVQYPACKDANRCLDAPANENVPRSQAVESAPAVAPPTGPGDLHEPPGLIPATDQDGNPSDGSLTAVRAEGEPLPVLPHRQPGQALARAEAGDQAQHDATMLLVRSGVDPADIAALAAPEPGEDTP
jgi:hypothetical protein